MKTTIISPAMPSLTRQDMLAALAESGFTPTSLISTAAAGADALAVDWALECGLPVISMPPAWDQHGRSAGYRRNTEVARLTDCVIAFWDGQTRYVGHLISEAIRFGKRVYIKRVQPQRPLPPPAATAPAALTEAELLTVLTQEAEVAAGR